LTARLEAPLFGRGTFAFHRQGADDAGDVPQKRFPVSLGDLVEKDIGAAFDFIDKAASLQSNGRNDRSRRVKERDNEAAKYFRPGRSIA
jgi:hypothetical protein